MTRPDRKTGTREWSDHSVNCCLGCRHGCLYCYARQAALRWGKIESGEDWTNERPDAFSPRSIRDAEIARRKHKGIVMFPTAHDITAGNAGACLATLVDLLAAENHVLVVSKAGAHVPPLLKAAREIARGHGSVELRVTVSCVNDDLRRFWESGAPDIGERLGALLGAHRLGLATSVSIEPCLEPPAVSGLIHTLERHCHVYGQIWIGAANHLRARTAWCRYTLGLEAEIRRIEAGQTPEKMREVFEGLKDNPQVRWKDSYQKALGIDAEGRPVKGAEDHD